MALVHLAHLGKPFAVKGWQFFHSYTQPEKIFSYSSKLFISKNSDANEWQRCRFAEKNLQSKRSIVRLEGVDTPERAALYSNCVIAVDRQFLPPLDNGYYWCDLIGLEVIHQDENSNSINYGKVVSLSSAGNKHDILEVKCKTSGKLRLIPFIENIYVKKVDLDSGLIHVFWPEDY